MKKSVLISIVGGVGILVIVGLLVINRGNSKMTAHDHDSNEQSITGIQTNNSSNNTLVATNKVTIKDFAFGPAKITVKKGTKVTWTNQDSAHHDITPDNASKDFERGPLLAQGESYSYTFEKAGTYTYHCSPHPYMKASVEVTE